MMRDVCAITGGWPLARFLLCVPSQHIKECIDDEHHEDREDKITRAVDYPEQLRVAEEGGKSGTLHLNNSMLASVSTFSADSS